MECKRCVDCGGIGRHFSPCRGHKTVATTFDVESAVCPKCKGWKHLDRPCPTVKAVSPSGRVAVAPGDIEALRLIEEAEIKIHGFGMMD